MKHPGSYESYKDAFIDFKGKINQIYESNFISKEFQSKKILDLTKKNLESDIFLEEEVIKNSKIPLFENLFGEFLNLLNESELPSIIYFQNSIPNFSYRNLIIPLIIK